MYVVRPWPAGRVHSNTYMITSTKWYIFSLFSIRVLPDINATLTVRISILSQTVQTGKPDFIHLIGSRIIKILLVK